MKYRTSFVTNSSSSSFVISKSKLTPLQILLIHNHIKIAQQLVGKVDCDLEYCDDGNAWSISETDSEITGYTMIDNFSISEFLRCIGVDLDDVEWDGENYNVRGYEEYL